MKIGNLPEKEFIIIILKMIQDLGRRMEKMQEMFTKDLGKTKEQTNRDEQCTKRNQQQNN